MEYAAGQYISPESKEKGDKGIYAAIDAAGLARALRGATMNRLTSAGLLPIAPASELLLGTEPFSYQSPTGFFDSIRCENRITALQSVRGVHDNLRVCVGLFDTYVPVGLPHDVSTEEFRTLLRHIKRLKPREVLRYDDWLCLVEILAMAKEYCGKNSSMRGSVGLQSCCRTLDLGGIVPPNRQPESSAEILQARIDELQRCYPLPVPTTDRRHRVSNVTDSSGDVEDATNAKRLGRHNAELRTLCEQLGIPSKNYLSAIRALAAHETRVFFLLCEYMSHDTHLRVLQLDRNRIGDAGDAAEELSKGNSDAAAATERSVDFAPIHALARMIDANESLWVLDLRHNRLGPDGIGILAKALTKNISLIEVDFSDNGLNTEPANGGDSDLQEDAGDPVFGPFYQGLEAISEVLKKNKFLRILHLCRNGIHAGDALTSPAPDDDKAEDIPEKSEEGFLSGTVNYLIDLPVGESYTQLVSLWQDLPLWKLVEPLCTYHRLEVLDLSGNELRDTGTRMLAAALAHNRSLKVLDLTDNAVGYNGLRYLASWVLASPSSALHTLILRRNALGGKQKRGRLPKQQALDAMGAFAQALKAHQGIRRLVLSDNHLGAVLSTRLLETIVEAKALEELDFSNNKACGAHPSSLDVAAARHVAAALLRQQCLHDLNNGDGRQWGVGTMTKLRFGGNNLCAAGLEALLPPGGAQTSWSLRELDLSRNSLGNALGPLSRYLAGGGDAPGPSATTFAASLSYLDLSHNEITSLHELTPGLLAAAANHTRHSPCSLTALDLSHNRLGCDDQALALEVDRRPSVTFPRASIAPDANCPPKGAVAKEMQQQLLMNLVDACCALARLPSLVSLNLSWNDLRAVHSEVIQRLFAPKSSSFFLSSSVDLLVDSRIASLLSATADAGTEPFASLQRLDLSNNAMLDIGKAKEFLQLVATRPGMEVLYMSPLASDKKAEDSLLLLHAIRAALLSSESLQDVRCGLRGVDILGPALQDSYGAGHDVSAEGDNRVAEVGEASAYVAAIQERLLLNALLQPVAGECD